MSSYQALEPAFPLKIAFIGGGYESAVGRVHRASVELDRRFQLVAGCFNRDLNRGLASAMHYGVSPGRSYNTVEALLEAESGRIDAVAVLTPQGLHAEQVTLCIEAGVPVICEKALAATVEEVEGLQHILQKESGLLAVTYNYTGYPMVRELRNMVGNGVLGHIQQLHMEMPQEGFAKLAPDASPIVPQDWRLHDGVIPTLSLDLGVHLHMMARFLLGQSPESLVATSSSLGNFKQIIDNVSCLVRYSGGVQGNLWYGKTALGYRNGLKLRLIGTEGAAEWVQEKPEHILFADNNGNRRIIDRASPDIQVASEARYERFKAGHPAGFLEAFANYYYDLADMLTAYKSGIKEACELNPHVFGVNESLEGLQMLSAIAKSSGSGRWESVG